MGLRRAAVAIGLGLALAATPARADDNADRIRTAAKEFDEGRRLYLENQFEQAAIRFENAYVDAPRAEQLRNAIRARRAAKQYARAATLAQLALDQYESDAATAQLANETLAEAAPRVHAVILACDPKCAVASGGRTLSLVDARIQRVFLDPGKQELVVSFGERTRQVKIDAKAGEKSELSLKPPDAPAAPPSPAPRTAPPPHAAASGKPLGPLVFVVLAGVTAIGGGATIVSGLDAKSNPGADAVKRDCVGLGESCPTYQRGRDAQLRTNILLGATAGLAVVTAVVGIFFTQWSAPEPSYTRDKSARFRITPFGVSGQFASF